VQKNLRGKAFEEISRIVISLENTKINNLNFTSSNVNEWNAAMKNLLICMKLLQLAVEEFCISENDTNESDNEV